MQKNCTEKNITQLLPLVAFRNFEKKIEPSKTFHATGKELKKETDDCMKKQKNSR